jgi:Peptidase inhibitor I78 family
MVGFGVRRVLCGGGIALAGFLFSPAAANAGACDAKKAKSLIGKSDSPRLEQKALELSGASDVALVGQGISNTADYRTDRVDLFLDRKGNIAGISCG